MRNPHCHLARLLTSRLLSAALIVAAVGASGIAATPAVAQQDLHMPRLAGLLPQFSPDTLIVLVPLQTEDDLRQAREDAIVAKAAAERDLERSQDRVAHVKALIESKKHDIKAIESEIKMADKEKNAGGKAQYEHEKKAEQLLLKVYEKAKEMREAEKDMCYASRQFAETLVKAYEAEEQLVRKIEDREKRARTGAVTDEEKASKMLREIHKLERKTLDAQKDTARMWEELAKKEREVLEKRIKVREAQEEMMAFDG